MSLTAVNAANAAAAEVQVLLAGWGLKESGGKASTRRLFQHQPIPFPQHPAPRPYPICSAEKNQRYPSQSGRGCPSFSGVGAF